MRTWTWSYRGIDVDKRKRTVFPEELSVLKKKIDTVAVDPACAQVPNFIPYTI